jgi:hypothetical protein
VKYNHHDDNRIPDELLIPTIVTVLDKKDDVTDEDEETGEENSYNADLTPKGKGCCGCLVALVLLYIMGMMLSFAINGF